MCLALSFILTVVSTGQKSSELLFTLGSYKIEDEIEDEIHFLTECELYETVRRKLYKDHNITSTNKDTKEIFIDCMKRNDKLYILDIASFVTACFEIRRIFLSSN